MTDTATAVGTAIDTFGLTHPGRVRDVNEDHFVIATVRKSVDVRQTSISSEALAHRFGSTGGYLLAVADGVGGGPEGELASERTVAAVLGYVGRAAECLHGLNAAQEHDLLARLEETIRSVHEELVAEYGGAGPRVPATTLTMVILVWPRAYLVHVGDSRAYVRRRGKLQHLTRDQTFGEYMVAAGAWTEEQAAKAPAAGTLSSAVGGSEITPVVGLVDLEPGDSLLLCTDGLCKHVTDERIGSVMAGPENAEAICRRLIDEALANGGTDNVTVVVAKTERT